MALWPELADSEEVVRVCCHQICGLSHFLAVVCRARCNGQGFRV